MKLYTLTHDQLLDLIFAASTPLGYSDARPVLARFLAKQQIPTRELSPAMEAQYSRQNTDDRGGSNEHAN